jgi:hypothetical protein
MHIEHESERFAWYYDSRMGVGRFVRKSDDALTYLETGTDCQDVRRSLRRLEQKTSSPRYPKAAPSFADIFDCIATEYEFHN